MLYTHLNSEEHGKIEAWLFDSLPIVEIAKRLGRHRSTIHRKLKRNSEVRKPNVRTILKEMVCRTNTLYNLILNNLFIR